MPSFPLSVSYFDQTSALQGLIEIPIGPLITNYDNPAGNGITFDRANLWCQESFTTIGPSSSGGINAFWLDHFSLSGLDRYKAGTLTSFVSASKSQLPFWTPFGICGINQQITQISLSTFNSRYSWYKFGAQQGTSWTRGNIPAVSFDLNIGTGDVSAYQVQAQCQPFWTYYGIANGYGLGSSTNQSFDMYTPVSTTGLIDVTTVLHGCLQGQGFGWTLSPSIPGTAQTFLAWSDSVSGLGGILQTDFNSFAAASRLTYDNSTVNSALGSGAGNNMQTYATATLGGFLCFVQGTLSIMGRTLSKYFVLISPDGSKYWIVDIIPTEPNGYDAWTNNLAQGTITAKIDPYGSFYMSSSRTLHQAQYVYTNITTYNLGLNLPIFLPVPLPAPPRKQQQPTTGI